MVDPANPIYYSMDGGASYDQPSNCVFSVTSQSADMVDVSFKRTWNSTAGYKHIFDIDLHYVLRRGDTGLYAYAILDHPAAYPAASVGEWRIVWKLPRSSTTFTFERAYIDDLRHWEMPSYYDYQHASATGIAEIVKLNTGVMAGKYDGKYSYAARYSESAPGATPATSRRKASGSCSVATTIQRRPHQAGSHVLRKLYSHALRPEPLRWLRHQRRGRRKLAQQFGPFLLYCNGTTAATNAGDALWADAKAQVVAEKAAWPYAWAGHRRSLGCGRPWHGHWTAVSI